jgi:hypothetical protein
LRPDNASVNGTWQESREVAGRKLDSSCSSSCSSPWRGGRRAAQASSTHTWQVAQEHIPPQIAATP